MNGMVREVNVYDEMLKYTNVFFLIFFYIVFFIFCSFLSIEVVSKKGI